MAERRVPDPRRPGDPRQGPRTVKAIALAAALLAGPACLAATTPAAAETRPPEPLRRSFPKPEYPLESRRRGEDGDVRVALRVDPTGAVQHVDILESSGSPALDTAALAAVPAWRFRPATRDGEPIAGSIRTVIRFRLRPPRRPNPA